MSNTATSKSNGCVQHSTTPKKSKYASSKSNHDRNFLFNNEMNLSGTPYTNDLKINSIQEPTTPIDKLNTPRTVTVPQITFFPPSPTNHMNENEISLSGKLIALKELIY